MTVPELLGACVIVTLILALLNAVVKRNWLTHVTIGWLILFLAVLTIL